MKGKRGGKNRRGKEEGKRGGKKGGGKGEIKREGRGGGGGKGGGGKGEKVEAERQPIKTLLNLPSLQGTDWVNLCHITHGAHALQRRTAPLANLQTQGKIARKRQ